MFLELKDSQLLIELDNKNPIEFNTWVASTWIIVIKKGDGSFIEGRVGSELYYDDYEKDHASWLKPSHPRHQRMKYLYNDEQNVVSLGCPSEFGNLDLDGKKKLLEGLGFRNLNDNINYGTQRKCQFLHFY
eukprot:Awhi_evm2s5619